MKFDHLILRKIIKFVATRRQILRLKCIKFDFGWCSGGRILKNAQVENVAIANALQLEAARRCADPIRFNFAALVKFEVAQPIRCRLRAFLLRTRYVTLWPWTLTPLLGIVNHDITTVIYKLKAIKIESVPRSTTIFWWFSMFVLSVFRRFYYPTHINSEGRLPN